MADRIITDTTGFYDIGYNDLILLGNKHYKVIGNAKELRFGIEDPKFWVKRVIDTETNERKILKLVFYETFETTLGGVKIKCFRDPEKEAAILKLVEQHPFFMHGTSTRDSEGNNVRILDVVRGTDLFVYIESLNMKHEDYFQSLLPVVLKRLAKAFEAIRFLHINGFRHGDVRNDHIIIEHNTGNYVWIDFDYDYSAPENPFSLDLFGMCNILLYVIGKGFHIYYAIMHDALQYGDLKDRITVDDFSLLDPSRLLNLKKLYPYMPNRLNDILMHFSGGSSIFYETADELIEDLNRCIYTIF
ncbi:MAG: protein kinase [Deltaproteobacteria bacterium]|nr:protein kinase [Deltaproteobacteria bacterium]